LPWKGREFKRTLPGNVTAEEAEALWRERNLDSRKRELIESGQAAAIVAEWGSIDAYVEEQQRQQLEEIERVSCAAAAAAASAASAAAASQHDMSLTYPRRFLSMPVPFCPQMIRKVQSPDSGKVRLCTSNLAFMPWHVHT